MPKSFVFSICTVCVAAAVSISNGAPPLTARSVRNNSREVPAATSLRATEETTSASTPLLPPAPPVYGRVDDSYVLRPGDRVSFSIEEDRKVPVEISVMASGELELPHIGRFQAAGKTCKTVAAQLKTELEKRYYKEATVNLAVNQVASSTGATGLTQGIPNIRVYFNGAAALNGAREFPSDGKITVSRALLISGGFKDFANQKKVQLIRKKPDGTNQIIVINVRDLLKGKPGNDPKVQEEDMIYVPERLFNF